jgi:hypothetical protein
MAPSHPPRSDNFSYHERRVLGSIVYAGDAGRFTLDRIDTWHAERLIKCKLIHRSTVALGEGTVAIYSPTELGKRTWVDWIAPPGGHILKESP